MAPIHLLVLVHGMWGNPNHLAWLKKTMHEKSSANHVHILVAETNRDDSTYDGIDWGGERVAEEVIAEVNRLEKDGKQVTRFSITGYSLGGLISRYVIGILRQKGFFDNITPVNFNTIATPHIGLLRYPTIISSITNTLGPRLLSRTGEQFYSADKWSTTGKPLLEVLAEPGQIFYQALAEFQRICIYANAINDITVPYATAAIEVDDPFACEDTNGIEIDLRDDYHPLIKSWSLPPVPPAPTPQPIVLSPEWFRKRKEGRPLLALPPFLRFRFPGNIIFYVLLPLLVPIAITVVLFRFMMASHYSRARIKLLEKDASSAQKLVNIIAHLEKRAEDAVAEMVDYPGMIRSDSDDSLSAAVSANRTANDILVHKTKGRKKSRLPREHPIVSPLQRKIAANLNRLPLKKELAYIPRVQNAHGAIICRDIKRFEFHKIGEGVVRHWADHFVL